MKYLDWNLEKNNWLKKNWDIGFEEIAISIIEGDLLDIIVNSSKNFPNQKVFVVKVNKYIYYVPFIEDEVKFFLKTIIPSRKATKKYLKKL